MVNIRNLSFMLIKLLLICISHTDQMFASELYKNNNKRNPENQQEEDYHKKQKIKNEKKLGKGLFNAIQNNESYENIAKLIRLGADINFLTYEYYDNKPIHIAIKLKRIDIIELLLDHNIDIHDNMGEEGEIDCNPIVDFVDMNLPHLVKKAISIFNNSDDYYINVYKAFIKALDKNDQAMIELFLENMKLNMRINDDGDDHEQIEKNNNELPLMATAEKLYDAIKDNNRDRIMQLDQIAKRLINMGADIDYQGHNHKINKIIIKLLIYTNKKTAKELRRITIEKSTNLYKDISQIVVDYEDLLTCDYSRLS